TDPTTSSFSSDLTGLHNGKAYSVSVRAHNAAGSGPAATTSVSPAAAPGVPTDLTGIPGDGYVPVYRDPPPSDGGSAIDRYTITVSAGSYFQTIQVSDLASAALAGGGTATYGAVTAGIADGARYTISVTAHNSAGTGQAATTSITPAATPGAPTGL